MPFARRAALAGRRLAGRRGHPRDRRLAAPSTRSSGRRCGSPWSGCPGCPTSPTSTPWPPSRGWTCWSPPTRRGRRTPTWPCCPAPGPPSPTWPGCGDAGWPTPSVLPGASGALRCWASAAAIQMLAATIDDDVESRRRPGRRARSAAGQDHASPRPRCWAGRPAPGAGTRCRRTRSTTAWPRCRGEAEPFLDGCRVGSGLGHDVARRLRERRVPPGLAGRGRGGERLGLAARARTRPATPSRRETMIDILADAVEDHLDLDLLLAGTRIAVGR